MRTLRNRDFRQLWISGGISGIGSWLLVVAIPFHVFNLTGSAVATGLALALEALPALLVGPWAGVLLDRCDLTRAMWIADLVSAAAVALILFADADRIWPVYLAILIESTATTVFRPASRALLPAVVGTGNELAAANALNSFTGSAIRLAAPPLGALLLAGPGIEFVLTVDIVSYLLSAAIITTVRTHRHASAERVGNPFAGFRYVADHRALRGILLGQAVFLTANAGLTALLVPFTVDRLHAPGYVLGYLISGLGAGYLIGAALSTKPRPGWESATCSPSPNSSLRSATSLCSTRLASPGRSPPRPSSASPAASSSSPPRPPSSAPRRPACSAASAPCSSPPTPSPCSSVRWPLPR
ncbi:transmembrane secretion effector [Kribbella steppae]|uniref:Transmembrane secretion effector n=1 Tax=Kribbella steppae TaxID=2512223 RepID=A0A4R2H2X4_9ACTN|nr:MFS transporter [Kribbella steppae]TCO19225.1 transmembrane secretion effector [Kribbella steppae]